MSSYISFHLSSSVILAENTFSCSSYAFWLPWFISWLSLFKMKHFKWFLLIRYSRKIIILILFLCYFVQYVLITKIASGSESSLKKITIIYRQKFFSYYLLFIDGHVSFAKNCYGLILLRAFSMIIQVSFYPSYENGKENSKNTLKDRSI